MPSRLRNALRIERQRTQHQSCCACEEIEGGCDVDRLHDAQGADQEESGGETAGLTAPRVFIA